ncbi:MAG: hypothetical protein SPF22_08085 [Candidatus Onthovivens sp.]|nr:hypothetical protein [Candidatus Onthovivens sp.]
MEKEKSTLDALIEEAPRSYGNDKNSGVLIIDDDEDVATVDAPEIKYDADGYPLDENGNRILGAISDRKDFEKSKEKTSGEGVVVGELKTETVDAAKSYIQSMDAEIIEAKTKYQKAVEAGTAPNLTPQQVVEIYIDKAQVGDLTFTPEQQARLEMASKIVINEVNEVKYKSIKIRRKDIPNDRDERLKIIEKAFDRTLSPFIAIGSGYLGKMGNCTTSEIMKLGKSIDGGRSLSTELERWQLLFDKMKYCSIGKFESFEDFLKNTAYDDYENLQYALICASFPETTNMVVTCPKCGTQYNYGVKNEELIRTDLVDDVMADNVRNIVTADTYLERAKEVHENALFNKISRISVGDDDNTILLDIYSPSAYDAIYRTYRDLDAEIRNNKDLSDFVAMSKLIRAAYLVVDTDETGEPIYDEFTDPNEILAVISKMSGTQVNKIIAYINESYLSHKYFYGIKDAVCPNEKCKAHSGPIPISMDSLLFWKVQG